MLLVDNDVSIQLTGAWYNTSIRIQYTFLYSTYTYIIQCFIESKREKETYLFFSAWPRLYYNSTLETIKKKNSEMGVGNKSQHEPQFLRGCQRVRLNYILFESAGNGWPQYHLSPFGAKDRHDKSCVCMTIGRLNIFQLSKDKR